MKGPLDRTKVVVRHLPPTISQSTLMEQIDGHFGGRYDWVYFLPGKTSLKRPGLRLDDGRVLYPGDLGYQSYSRAYIDFKNPEDVIEFAEFFDGHVFVNTKGIQFKTIVEYAPSQRVPRQYSKKDGREGTILKDPEYLEFLEFIAKPIENLPSAEIQLERRDAERAGAVKDASIITPLMIFVRQKRAATKGGFRRHLSNGKPTRKATGTSSGSRGPTSSRRGSERRKISTTMYILRDTAKSTSGKEKSTDRLKLDGQQISDKSVASASAFGTEVSEEERGISGSIDIGRKKILLLKGKEREIHHVSGAMSSQQSATSVKNSLGSSAFKQNEMHDGSGRMIKSILLNKDARKIQSRVANSELQIHTSTLERDKRPPRPHTVQLSTKDVNRALENKFTGIDLHGSSIEKQEKRTRNKDRPDRGVWTPLRRSDGTHASDESLSSCTSQSTQLQPDVEGGPRELKSDMSNSRNGDAKAFGSARNCFTLLDNGSHKHSGRQWITHNLKDADGSYITGEGKPSKRGGSSSYGSHEKQIWVQKSSAGS